MKIGLKIRKILNCKVLQCLMKHFLNTWYESANKWVDDFTSGEHKVTPHNAVPRSTMVPWGTAWCIKYVLRWNGGKMHLRGKNSFKTLTCIETGICKTGVLIWHGVIWDPTWKTMQWQGISKINLILLSCQALDRFRNCVTLDMKRLMPVQKSHTGLGGGSCTSECQLI